MKGALDAGGFGISGTGPCRISKPNFCAVCGTLRSLAPTCGRAAWWQRRCSASGCSSGAAAGPKSLRCATSARIRGIPLHYGRFDGKTIACSYHGWRFNMDGACVEIPSLREGQQVDLTKIRCGSYPCVERQGVIWVYFPQADETTTSEPPHMPVLADDARPLAAIMLPFPCSTDHAAFGLMDPTHAAFVHTSWWFKKEATKLRPKEKHFEPIKLGWRMVRHPLPPQNLVYRLLGSSVETEISYQLPGLRIEEIHGDRHTVVGLTAITPITDETTEVYQIFWASLRWAGVVLAALQAPHAYLPRPGSARRGAAARRSRARPAADADQ